MLIFFIIFTIAIQNQILNAKYEHNEVLTGQLFNVINNEIVLAHAVNDGYERVFYLPGQIDGGNYTVTFTSGDHDVFIFFRGKKYLYFLDYNETFTTLQPGPNVIRNY